MKNISARPADDIEVVVRTYGDMLFRLCLVTLGNTNDAEDAVQETMIKYMQKAPRFESEEHKKAWLIKVASNQCKDMIRYRKRHMTIDIEQANEGINENTDSGILDVLMTLPDKYRMVLELYYVEEYSIESIAKIAGRTTSAIKMRLQKGRRLLSEAYGKECM